MSHSPRLTPRRDVLEHLARPLLIGLLAAYDSPLAAFPPPRPRRGPR